MSELDEKLNSILSNPAMMFSSVDLPEPDSPQRANNPG